MFLFASKRCSELMSYEMREGSGKKGGVVVLYLGNTAERERQCADSVGQGDVRKMTLKCYRDAYTDMKR